MVKKHPEAVDLNIGEQATGAVNELRGTFLTKDGRNPWHPPENLIIDEDWTLSDERIVDLVHAAKYKSGPLGQIFGKKTSSTSNGRVATFFVDYVAAIVWFYEHAQCEENMKEQSTSEERSNVDSSS